MASILAYAKSQCGLCREASLCLGVVLVQVQHSDLHGVYCNINVTPKQGIIDFFGEQSFATNVGQRLVQHLVSSGFDDDNVQSSLLCQLRECSLQTNQHWSALRLSGHGQPASAVQCGAQMGCSHCFAMWYQVPASQQHLTDLVACLQTCRHMCI